MFSIAFNNDRGNEAEGTITFGADEETFVSTFRLWGCIEYRDQWREALSRVLGGKPAALITDMTPVTAKFLTWWPMWREEDYIVVHNQLFFYAQRGVYDDITIEKLYDLIGPRKRVNEEGIEISEWIVDVSEVWDFLAHL